MRIPSSSLLLLATIFVVLPLPEAHAGELPDELEFLRGCWRGEVGRDGSRIIEQYSDTDGEMLLGQLKTVKGSETVFFEFLEISSDEDGVWLQPYPNGVRAPVRFRLVELESDKASFDNPEHDFPRRITYRLLPGGELLTRVAGIVGERTMVEEYRSLPAACD